MSVGLTFVVIALRSDSRVHGRTAAPGAVVLVEGGAVVLVEGLVLLRELGRHGRLRPVGGDGFKPPLFDRLKTLMESGDFQGQPVDRTVDAQDWIVSLALLRLEGTCSFPLFPGSGGEVEENKDDDDAECDGVDDQMRVHLRLLGVVQRGGRGVRGRGEAGPALAHSPECGARLKGLVGGCGLTAAADKAWMNELPS